MNEMYVLLAVATVLSSVFIPTIYFRIKEKELFETLNNKFIECEIVGYRTMDSMERQILKEDYEVLKTKNSKILYLIIIVSTILTGVPILDQLIKIPLWIENMYIYIILIGVLTIPVYISQKVLQFFDLKTFRMYQRKILLQYIYRHMDIEMLNIILESIILNLMLGIFTSTVASMLVGYKMVWPVENAYILFCFMLFITNIIVVINVCKKQHKYLEQLIIDEAGLC